MKKICIHEGYTPLSACLICRVGRGRDGRIMRATEEDGIVSIVLVALPDGTTKLEHVAGY